jgi:hypothetical protein
MSYAQAEKLQTEVGMPGHGHTKSWMRPDQERIGNSYSEAGVNCFVGVSWHQSREADIAGLPFRSIRASAACMVLNRTKRVTQIRVRIQQLSSSAANGQTGCTGPDSHTVGARQA